MYFWQSALTDLFQVSIITPLSVSALRFWGGLGPEEVTVYMTSTQSELSSSSKSVTRIS